MQTISTSKFARIGNKTFVADISDLGPGFRLEQVYPDAADGGFRLQSNWTGETLDMVQVSESKSEEGEVQAWHFEPTRSSWKRLGPYAARIRVTLFND